MDNLKLFVQLQKIDEAQRIVYGTAISEATDLVKEVFDYDTSKPLFEKWSSGFDTATDGKSLGNVRAMHGNVAAGKLTQIEFDDARKAIDVAAKIIDDNEWNKVVEGVYTGFSIGGKYVKKWKDGDTGTSRYTAQPSEISLVDLPCVPTATFAMIKADGSEIKKVFKGAAEQIEAKARELAKAAGGDPDKTWKDFAKQAADDLAKAPVPVVTEVAAVVVEPANDAVVAKAIELAKAAGEGKSWMEFVTQAHDLLKAAPAADTKPAAIAHGDTPADDGTEAQVWIHKRLPGKTYATKGAMREALVQLDASETVGAATKPARELLKSLHDELTKREPVKTDPPVPEAKPAAEVAKRDYSAEQRTALAKKGQAMADGSLPIVDGVDLAKAIADFAGLTKGKTAARRFITKRAKALKATDTLPAEWRGSTKDKAEKLAKIDTPELKKAASIQSVVELLYNLSSLERAEEALESGLDPAVSYYGYPYYSPDGTRIEVPKALCDRMGALVVELGDCIAEVLDAILGAMRDEEAGEALALAAPVIDLMKIGARHSKSDQGLLDKIHDHAVDLGAACDKDAGKVATGDDLAKRDDVVKRLQAENTDFKKSIDDMTTTLSDIAKRMKLIEDQPLPVGHSTAVRVVEKKDDTRAMAELEKTADELLQNPEVLKSLGDAAIRAAQRTPMQALPGFGSAR